jgi:hypothetical protein
VAGIVVGGAWRAVSAEDFVLWSSESWTADGAEESTTGPGAEPDVAEAVSGLSAFFS